MGALCSNNTDSVEWGSETSESVDTSWADAVNHGFIGECQMLRDVTDRNIIESPVNIHGERAIHVAAATKNHELLMYLLANKADVNAKAPLTGNTALHEAALLDDTMAILILLVHGADQKILNSKRELAKDLAMEEVQEQFFDVPIDKGRDGRGRTVFSVDGGENWCVLPTAAKYGLSGFV